MTLTIACQACREAFKAAGGDAAGWSIFAMLVVVFFMMVVVGISMARIARRQKKAMPAKYRDPLQDKKS